MFRDALLANLTGSVVFFIVTILFSLGLLLWRRRKIRANAAAVKEIREMSPATCIHCPFCHKSIVLDLSTGGHGKRHVLGRELCSDCSRLCKIGDEP